MYIFSIKKYVIFFIVILIPILSFSQPSKGEANSNYEFSNYEIALQQYLKLLKTDKKNSFFQYRIGQCYLNTNLDKKAALPYLQFAAKDEKTPNTITFDIGKAYFYANKFDSAIIFFNKYENANALPDSEKVKTALFKNYAINAKKYTSNPVDVSLINLGANINTKRADYTPHVAEDESVLYFTSNKKYISDFQQLLNCVYVSKTVAGQWEKMKSIGTNVNTGEEDAILCGVSKDGNDLYIQPKSLGLLDIYWSKKVKNKFGTPVDLGKVINTKWEERGITTSMSGDTLYFSSAREGGLGKLDIYMTIKLPNGEWGIPKNLGNKINSVWNEDYPYLSWDGTKLYFCSDGDKSMGGFDIFVSDIDENGNFSEPQNLGYPINDTYDNFNISLTKNGSYGYVSLTRDGGFGDLDIYKVIFNKIEKENIIYKGIIAVGDSINPTQLKDLDPNISITVLNAKDEEVFGNYSYNQNTGKYIISLPPGKYILLIEGDSYVTYKKNIDVFEGIHKEKEFIKNIYLKKK